MCILRVNRKGMFSFLWIAARSYTMRFMRFSVYEWHASDTLRSSCWSKGRCNIPFWLRHGRENSWTSKSYRIQAQNSDSIQFPLLLFHLLNYMRMQSLSEATSVLQRTQDLRTQWNVKQIQEQWIEPRTATTPEKWFALVQLAIL